MGDELSEGVNVLVYAVEGLFLVLAGNPAETRAGCVDKHEVGGVEQALIVVDDVIGRGRVALVERLHSNGAEGAHVQPDGR